MVKGKLPPQALVAGIILVVIAMCFVNILPFLVNYLNITFNSSDTTINKNKLTRNYSIAQSVFCSFASCSFIIGILLLMMGNPSPMVLVGFVVVCLGVLFVNILPFPTNYFNISINSSDNDQNKYKMNRNFSITHGVFSSCALCLLGIGTLLLILANPIQKQF